MKRIALILMASALALGNVQAQKKQKRTVNLYDVDSVVYVPSEYDRMAREASKLHMTYPIDGPKKMHIEVHEVMVAMNKIAQLYGLKDEVQTESARQPESGALVSCCNIIPFRADVNDRFSIEKAPSAGEYEDTDFQKLIGEAKKAFRSCSISYSSGYLQGRMYGENYSVQIAPGKSLNLLCPTTDEQLIYMEVKNKENPQLRDFFAVKWENEDSATICGSLYFITNRRPDLVENDEQASAKVSTSAGVMSRWDIDFERHLKLLGALADKYESDLKQLYFDLHNSANSKEKKLIQKQYNQLSKKRQEVIDEMHSLIMIQAIK